MFKAAINVNFERALKKITALHTVWRLTVSYEGTDCPHKAEVHDHSFSQMGRIGIFTRPLHISFCQNQSYKYLAIQFLPMLSGQRSHKMNANFSLAGDRTCIYSRSKRSKDYT